MYQQRRLLQSQPGLLSQKGAERPKGFLKGDILALRRHLRDIHVSYLYSLSPLTDATA